MVELFLEAVKSIGPTAAIIMFFLYKDFLHDAEMSKRVNELNKFVQEKLIDMNTQLLNALAQQTQLMRMLVQVLRTRACIAREMRAMDQTLEQSDEPK